jgi:hypothetical protein
VFRSQVAGDELIGHQSAQDSGHLSGRTHELSADRASVVRGILVTEAAATGVAPEISFRRISHGMIGGRECPPHAGSIVGQSQGVAQFGGNANRDADLTFPASQAN